MSDISFEIKKGETVGFIGRNGAGKSTLLGLIAQVMLPTSGNVTVNSRVSSLLELGAGFHPDLTGRENLELYGVVLGFTRDEVAIKADSIIKYSGLDTDIDVPIRFYSSGMLARLGFSIIAHLDPEILLIDEVLAVGDHVFQEKCMETMSAFRKEGKTMIIVSHSSADIQKLCDRVFWIDNHKVRAVGLPEDVIKQYHEE
ncbi:MAG: ABC transporter ATP-binding protein [Methylococcales bacterium]